MTKNNARFARRPTFEKLAGSKEIEPGNTAKL